MRGPSMNLITFKSFLVKIVIPTTILIIVLNLGLKNLNSKDPVKIICNAKIAGKYYLAQDEYEKTISVIEEKIKKVRTEAKATRDQLELEALKEKERLIDEVSKESKAQIKKAKADLDEQMKGLLEEMEAKSEMLAESIEKRLLH